MSIWWYFSTITASAGILYSLMTAVNLIRGIFRCKEKAIVVNLYLLICYIITIAAFCSLIAFGHSFRVPWILMTIFFIISVFCNFIPVTPQGIIQAYPFGLKMIPNEEYSYEYSKDKLGECVKLYRKGVEKPAVFHIGIHKPSTVKILADWYGKHGYENPLTK